MDERVEVVVGQTAMVVQSCIGLVVLCTIFILQCIALKEKFRKLVWARRTDRNIYFLMGLTCCSIIFYSVSLAMYTINWVGREDACNITGQPFIPLIFIVSKQFLYYFLYERASIVLETLQLNSRFFLTIRYVIALAVLIGIPAAFYWSFFIVFSCKVFVPEGVCVLQANNRAPMLAFAALDVLLSLTLLFLFAYPLYTHLRQMKNESIEQPDRTMYKVLRRNMILSTIITTSTSGNLVAMVVLLTFHGTGAPRQDEFWQIYAMHFPAWDILISCSAALAMSVAWMPKFLVDTIASVKTDEEVSAGSLMQRSKPTPVASKDNTDRSRGIVAPGSELTSTDLN